MAKIAATPPTINATPKNKNTSCKPISPSNLFTVNIAPFLAFCKA